MSITPRTDEAASAIDRRIAELKVDGGEMLHFAEAVDAALGPLRQLELEWSANVPEKSAKELERELSAAMARAEKAEKEVEDLQKALASLGDRLDEATRTIIEMSSDPK